MITAWIKCDWCDNKQELVIDNREMIYPDGWIRIKEKGKATLHMCSEECIQSHLKNIGSVEYSEYNELALELIQLYYLLFM